MFIIYIIFCSFIWHLDFNVNNIVKNLKKSHVMMENNFFLLIVPNN